MGVPPPHPRGNSITVRVVSMHFFLVTVHNSRLSIIARVYKSKTNTPIYQIACFCIHTSFTDQAGCFVHKNDPTNSKYYLESFKIFFLLFKEITFRSSVNRITSLKLCREFASTESICSRWWESDAWNCQGPACQQNTCY